MTNRSRQRPTCRERPQKSATRSPQTMRSGAPPRRSPTQPWRNRSGGRSFCESVLEQHLDGAHAVAPADLLALRAAARLEANRQFENRVTGAQQLRGDFGLDVETV